MKRPACYFLRPVYMTRDSAFAALSVPPSVGTNDVMPGAGKFARHADSVARVCRQEFQLALNIRLKGRRVWDLTGVPPDPERSQLRPTRAMSRLLFQRLSNHTSMVA